jgi:hypothetical protein
MLFGNSVGRIPGVFPARADSTAIMTKIGADVRNFSFGVCAWRIHNHTVPGRVYPLAGIGHSPGQVGADAAGRVGVPGRSIHTVGASRNTYGRGITGRSD